MPQTVCAATQEMVRRYGARLERLDRAQKLAIIAALSETAYLVECSPPDDWSVRQQLEYSQYAELSSELESYVEGFDHESTADALMFVAFTIAML